jgi:hypothetical protein
MALKSSYWMRHDAKYKHNDMKEKDKLLDRSLWFGSLERQLRHKNYGGGHLMH